MKRFARACLFALCVALGNAHASSDEDLVAMVEARFGESANRERGAGIVVEDSPERIVIVTALHVVETADGDKATDITVELSPLRGQVFKATSNAYYADPTLDIAVLFVDRAQGRTIPKLITETNRGSISPSLPTSLSGATVKIIGAMRRERWATGKASDRIVSTSNRAIRIASNAASAGASGSAVFDTLGRLLGMGTNVDSSTGYLEAVPMSVITKKLQGWKLSVGLTVAEAGTTSEEISSRFSKELQISSTYVPGPVDQGFSTTFRLTAKVTPLLRSLSPTKIELSYSRWYPEVVYTATLLPPDFSVEHSATPRKENAQVWVSIADGRRLGPFPLALDFETEPLAAIRKIEPRHGTAAMLGTLKVVQIQLDTEKNNEKGQAEILRELAQNQRENELRDSTPTAEDFAEVRDSFHDWDERCRKKIDSPWECDYPIFLSSNRLRALRSVQLGTSANNLKVNLPVEDIEGFRPAFARAAAKLLEDNPEMTEMHLRVLTAEGDTIGPKVICRVSRRKDTRGYCTDR